MASRFRTTLKALTLAAAMMWLGAGAVLAQYGDETLTAFVDAAIKVEALMQQRDTALETAPSEGDAQRIREEKTAEMAAAVEATPGISVDEYLEINRVSREDPELMKRILTLYGNAVSNGATGQ